MAEAARPSWIMRPGTWAGLTIIVFVVVFVTPYCGLLFSCGCTWPWAGLDANCNIHDHDALHVCPWCGSLYVGGLSTLAMLGASYAAAAHPLGSWVGALKEHDWQPRTFSVFASGILSGITAFLVVGFVTAWIAALWTGYPDFLIPGIV